MSLNSLGKDLPRAGQIAARGAAAILRGRTLAMVPEDDLRRLRGYQIVQLGGGAEEDTEAPDTLTQFGRTLAVVPDEELIKLPQYERVQTGREEGGATKALDALTKFIPAEMLAPYVTALSLAVNQGWDAADLYWGFVIATPFVFLLFELAKSAIDKKPWPDKSPLVWRALAATIAFAVWGLSVPTNPLQAVIGGAAVAGFFAVVVSPILWAADAIVLRLLGAAPTS